MELLLSIGNATLCLSVFETSPEESFNADKKWKIISSSIPTKFLEGLTIHIKENNTFLISLGFGEQLDILRMLKNDGNEEVFSSHGNSYWYRRRRWSTASLKGYSTIESFLHSLEQAAKGISLFVNSDKKEFMYFNPDGTISSSNGKPLTSLNLFIYLSSTISSTETTVNTCRNKTWTFIDRLLTIWKSILSENIKGKFFQALASLGVMFGCTLKK